MENNFLKLFQIPETRQRIFRTLALLICYRVGFQIPLPGMSAQFLQQAGDRGVIGLLSAMSGGALGQTTIFALGIMPYISASIIFSMLTKVSPTLEAVAKEGAAGQKKINQWTRLATVPIALIQSLFIYLGIFRTSPEMVTESMRGNFALALIVIKADGTIEIRSKNGTAEALIPKSHYDVHYHPTGTGPSGPPHNASTSGTTVIKGE